MWYWLLWYVIGLAIFIFMWWRFHDSLHLPDPEEHDPDYMIGDDDSDWGDKS